MVEQEKAKIWTPSMNFDNTNQKIQTFTDEESLVTVKLEGYYSRKTIDTGDNVYICDGAENPI